MEIDIQQSIINQIAAYCPIFGGKVAGTASLTAFQKNQQVNLAQPAAYVVPLAGDAADNEAQPGYMQFATDVYGVMIVLSNSGNPDGKKALRNIDEIRWQLIGAICNWNPNPMRSVRGMRLASWRTYDIDGAYVWYLYTFEWDFQVTQPSVWNPQGTKLGDISISYTDRNIAFNNDVEFSNLNANVSESGNASDITD